MNNHLKSPISLLKTEPCRRIKCYSGYFTYAIVCGPPVMFKFICNMLNQKDIPMQKMFVSLERRMHCGMGKCCRCNVGSTYTCLNGPVFDYWTVMNLKEAMKEKADDYEIAFVECVHVVNESLGLIEELLDSEWAEPRQEVVPGKGTGVGAVEAPRGILYHCYEFDEAGHIVKCDCVIPTSQNHANIQHDLEELAGRYTSEGMKDRSIELLAEMLVRSYDPCISCSVH